MTKMKHGQSKLVCCPSRNWRVTEK